MITVSSGIAALLGLGLAATAAGCAASSSGRPPTAELAKKYLAIATPANRVLDRSFDALADDDDEDLGASSTLLRTIAATERHFDGALLTLKLPSKTGATAIALVRVNEARADLTSQAASATSVASLKRYEPDLNAMNAPVEVQVRVLRRDLGLPPPDTD